MKTITITARFQRGQVVLDEPLDLPQNTRLMVTVLPEQDAELEGWEQFAGQSLELAYGEEEVEYSLADVKSA